MNTINSLLGPLEAPLRAYLKFLHGSVGLTWALSIIALTLSVRIVMIPLTVKQQMSMRRMSDLQPLIKKLKAEHGHDKQLMNQKMMELYKTERVNPFASCLPLVIQAPIFIALYYMLRHADNLIKVTDNRSFISNGFVSDVTAPLRHSATSPPGWALVLMLALYVGSQVGATLVTPSTLQGAQKTIMAVAPIGFVFFIINGHFPVGLLLYWITTNVFTLAQATVIRVFYPPPQYLAAKEEARKKAATLASSKAAREPQAGGLMGRLRRASGVATAEKTPAANASGGERARGATLSKKQPPQKQQPGRPKSSRRPPKPQQSSKSAKSAKRRAGDADG